MRRNKYVIYFYFIRRPLHIEQAGRDEGEEENSNKGGDLYGGGSPLSHVILWELAGGPQVIFPHSEEAANPPLHLG